MALKVEKGETLSDEEMSRFIIIHRKIILRKLYAKIEDWFILLLIIIFAITDKSVIFYVLISFLLFGIIFYSQNNSWQKVSFNLVLQPLSFMIIVIGGFLTIVDFFGINHSNNLFLNVLFTIIFFSCIPGFSALFFFRNLTADNFLKNLKVSLELNNLIYFFILTSTLMYLSSTNNLENLFPSHFVSIITKEQTSLKEGLSLLMNAVSFPFLVANSLLKWLLELFEAKNKT